MKLTVSEVQTKQSKDKTKTFYIVVDSKGEQYSTFNEEVLSLKPGSVIETEVEVKGKYKNIDEFEFIEVVTPPTVETNQYKADPDKIASYNQQSALTFVSNLLMQEIIDLDSPLAQQAMKWAIIQLGGKETDIVMDKPHTKTTPATSVEKEDIKTDKPKFKNGAELVAYAQKEKRFSLEQIYETLGIKSPAEIKDVKLAAEVLLGESK